MPLINQVPESAPTRSNIIIGELIDLMFFDTFSKISSADTLFLNPTKYARAAPISKINWFDPSIDESP